jgi:hypothetical protein
MGQTLVARVHRTLIGLRLLRTRPFAVDDPTLSFDRPASLSIGPEGDLELRQYLIKSPTPVRLAQEGLSTGYIIELRDTDGASPEAFSQALARLDVSDEVYLDEDGLLRRSVRALESGSDLRFDVPAWDPNLRLFLHNPEARIVRTHNGRDITPDALLNSPAHGIRRTADG